MEEKAGKVEMAKRAKIEKRVGKARKVKPRKVKPIKVRNLEKIELFIPYN